MIKIALSGKLGSGKNEFLNIAQRLYPELELVEEKFASFLYMTMNKIQDVLEVEKMKDGKLLQFLGSHYKELYGENFWCNKLMDTLENSEVSHVITDNRFPAELKYCKEHGYTLVRIHRAEEFRLNSLGNRDKNHISETALDKVPDGEFDYIINNNGDLDLLEGAVCVIMNNLLRKRT